jgi:hypothetical protein
MIFAGVRGEKERSGFGRRWRSESDSWPKFLLGDWRAASERIDVDDGRGKEEGEDIGEIRN